MAKVTVQICFEDNDDGTVSVKQNGKYENESKGDKLTHAETAAYLFITSVVNALGLKDAELKDAGGLQ